MHAAAACRRWRLLYTQRSNRDRARNERSILMRVLNLRTVFLVNSVVLFVFALGLLLGPMPVLKLFGLSTGNTELLAAQFFGTALVSIALLTWFARDFTDQTASRATALALFFGAICGLVVTLLGTLSRVIRSNSWILILLYLLFIAAYGYLQFFKQSEPQTSF
jgi:hypothetical protein